MKLSRSYIDDFAFYSNRPLHIASGNNRFKLIPLLTVIKGVDEAAVNNFDRTPLSLAIFYEKVDSVRALLELNVDTTKAVTRADTPREIIDLLRQHKARSVENEKRIA